MFRTLLMLGFWLVGGLFAALLSMPWAFLSGDVRLIYQMGTWVGRIGVRLAGVRVEVEGLNRLDPLQTYIFMSNHASNLDPPVLIPRIPRRTSVVAKVTVFRIPILGRAMRMARLVPIDRESREQSVGGLRAAGEVLRDGINMTIFIEGTRSRDGRLLPFKKGPFYLAMETGAPVVPVTIAGTQVALPKGRFLVRPGLVRIVFHAPLDPKTFADRDSLMEAVRGSIASAL